MNSRMNNAEERISDLEDMIMEITQSEQQIESQMIKQENNIRDLWGNIKCANLCIIGIPEGEERERGIENVFEEIKAENFPNRKKETDFQVQEEQRVPNKINPNRLTARHIIIKMAIKAAREKQRVNYKGTPIRLSADFSTKMLQVIREWQDMFKALKGKNLQSRILYPARFRIEGEIMNFSDKQKLKEYSTTNIVNIERSSLTRKKKVRLYRK